MSYSSHGSHTPRGRRRSLPDHSDDSRSRSRSEFTTTGSSPGCSTWTDTYSSEHSSLPADPSHKNGGETSTNNTSKSTGREIVQPLTVKLPPEKRDSSEENRRIGLRRRSKSLESIILSKHTDKLNETNSANREVESYTERNDKKNKTKNKLKAVFSSLKNSKKFLLALSRPISSASVELTPEGSQKSEIYVRQLVKDSVAAQAARATNLSQEPTRKTESSKKNTPLNSNSPHQRKVLSPNNSRNTFNNGEHSPPPPPAPPDPDPIVKVKRNTFYISDDGRVYAKSEEGCTGDYIDAAYAQDQIPSIKTEVYENSKPIGSETCFNSELTNSASNKYDIVRLPHIGSCYELKRFERFNIPSTSNGISNFDYERLNTKPYERHNPVQDCCSRSKPCRRLPEIEIDIERQKNATLKYYEQINEDYLAESHCEQPKRYDKKNGKTSHQRNPNWLTARENFNKSSNAIKPEAQQNRPHSTRYYFDQSELYSHTEDYHEPRRQLGPTLNLPLPSQFRDRQSVQTRDTQPDQPRSGQTDQPRERHLQPNREQRSQIRQQQLTVPKRESQPKETHSHEKVEHLASTTKNHNYDTTQSNKPGDRPANPFWRRDFSAIIELDSPAEADNTDVSSVFSTFRFDRHFYRKGFERKTQRYPRIGLSPSTVLGYPFPPAYSHYSVEFENLPVEERYIDRNPYRDRRDVLARERYPERHMGRMGSLEDHERKVIIEFCHLLEKSKQLFNGLRELPQYGHKQWHSYFGRTFDVYTKLWKFQQQHRAVLDSKYGLKRWQIGEIASKIGQLYYHFYLRTSETAYLNEAFSFYYAIRGRSYYTKASKEDKCELMVKKLRYYARFIVVCLLLKKVKLVRELIKELDRQIVEYGNTYDPDDQIEWTVVVDEVKAFIQTEPIVSVIHPDNYPVLLSHRLSPLTTPPVERSQLMSLSLQEVLIVGSSSQQVKFSELTMDMFRMLQTLEREPTGEIQHMYDDSPRQRFNLTPSALNNKGYNLETGGPRSDNPHKYLLFKPSPSQILVYLASGCNDLPPNGVLLLYISADGQIVQPSKHPEDGYDIGGLITTSKNEVYRDNKDKSSQSKNRELQCLHPGDLYPFTRRPLFIIIDSDNSVVFQNIPRHFGQPMVILMSPIEMPSGLHITQSERKHQGSLFTLFLHSPLTAICYCSDLHSVPLIHWDRAQAYIDTFLAEASQIVTRGRIDPMFLNFMGDDFLRLLILRYMFCELVLRMHRAFRTRTQRPRSAPGIPDEILEHPALVHIIFDLANHLQVRASFQEPNGNVERTSKE